MVDGFKLALPKIVTDLNWAVAEESKTPDQLIQDGLDYLKTIKGTDDYVIQLNSFAAKVQKWFSDNQGLGLTIQQALLSPQIVHNPTLLGIATDVQAVINEAPVIIDSVVAESAPQITTEATVIPNGPAS